MADERPGGEPTEEPTPRRLRKAREEGDVARSGELTSAAAFLAGCGALAAGAATVSARLAASFRRGLALAVAPEPPAAGTALEGALRTIVELSAPIVGAAFVAALVVGGLQAGGVFSWKPLAPRAARLNPLTGLGRIVSRDAFAQAVKALAKLALLAAVAWWTLAPRAVELPRLAGASAGAALAWTGAVALRLILRVAGVWAIVAVADTVWQRRQWLRRLRMTREEVKRELKESEGDPRHKAERQRAHRDLLRHQMVEAVRRADCVIVNPDHIAVAIRFEESTMGAPQVVAKGERLVAEQIKEVARRHGVPIYRDVALARALNELELGDEIPEALYEAVAEVLRFVYREHDR